jgi:rod shape determining protein RodA
MNVPRQHLRAGAGWLQRSFDPWLLLGLLALAGIGAAVLYSAGGGDPALVQRHGLRLAIGLVLLVVLAHVPPPLLRGVSPWFYALSIVLLLAVALFGVGRSANHWLDLGIIRFQPAEMVKLSLPMMMAWLLHSQATPPRPATVLQLLVLMAVPVLMIVKQPDLGTAVLVAASGATVLFLSGLAWRWIVLAGAALAAAAPVAWYFLQEYQRNRVRTFLDPEADPLGQGWNIIQSKIAVGSGGLHGKGFLQGTQSQLQYLPEHTTDFAVAVLAEEFGFVGMLVLFALCLLVGARALWIATGARDSYARLLAGALALTFLIYVCANAAMVSGLLPVVGVPMPFISYGGTSTVTLLAGFGIVMAVHRHQRRGVPRSPLG